jgi:hypothetical protein
MHLLVATVGLYVISTSAGLCCSTVSERKETPKSKVSTAFDKEEKERNAPSRRFWKWYGTAPAIQKEKAARDCHGFEKMDRTMRKRAVEAKRIGVARKVR